MQSFYTLTSKASFLSFNYDDGFDLPASDDIDVTSRAAPAEDSGQKERQLQSLLLEIDPSGLLLQYSQAISQCFDSVNHFETSCQESLHRGQASVDVFFAKVGILDLDHQELISKWFAGPSQRRSTSSSSSNGEAGSLNLQRITLLEWLHHVAPDGSLVRYLSRAEENWDTPHQIRRIYVDTGPAGAVLDPLFFEDLAVHAVDHQLMFLKWFTKHYHTSADAGDLPWRYQSLADWLKRHGLFFLEAALLQAGYNNLELLRTLQASQLEKLFQKIGIRDVERNSFRTALLELRVP
mmetsp:Transcript_91747/g.201152  ORF Transcript_91747/g.201152 Transcript_91747/m.201152 type:complete len:294 (+) Transcript_91747:35-916(+)